MVGMSKVLETSSRVPDQDASILSALAKVPIVIDETSPAALHLLSDLMEGHCLLLTSDGTTVTLPPGVLARMRDTVFSLAVGPADEELTAQEAAKIIGVSRPTLIKLLDTENIPYRVTEGQHRRISRRGVVEYHKRDLVRRRELLDELALTADEFGFFD